MEYQELADFLQHVGKDPSALIFEDELTAIHNRRFLLSYLEHKVDWRGGSNYPLALLNLDLDKFKEVNDSHGHETGDQVLKWGADLLRSVAGDEGLPVRYGGDEFLLLLPGTDRDGALAVADRLLETTRDRPFRERDTGLVIPVTFSVGIAVAPEDADFADALIHAADTALYVAKHRGRDQAALASELEEDNVVPKIALQRIKLRGIAGREEELGTVDRALRGMTSGRSQVLVFEGAPGVGKTTLLDAVWRNLKADGSFSVTRVSGDPQEARRPYYLTGRILIDLLNQQGDEGVDLLHRLPDDERAYLAHVLPGLAEEDVPGEVDRDTRQGIFTTFTRLIREAVVGQTLILLVDDMEFADEATLLLLRVAAERGDFSFMLCGTVGETLRLSGETDPSPVERFFADCPEEIRLRRVALTPLGPSAIAEYLKTVFPNVQMPEGFEVELVAVTNGNPLFISAIVRSLLEEGKVQLVGQDWVIEPVDSAYLARSLEDIVTEKIAALDDKDREILERASTLGDEIPVSILTGSSDLDESSVQAFLDRAENLGLVSLDFHLNDEVMHFLGKAILDISYGAIGDSRRQELHEEVGEYQERLFEQGLLPSASMLAYHFRRSANEAKAQRYEQIQQAYVDSIFDPSEVATYTDEDQQEEIEAGAPLDAEAVALVPEALRMTLSAMRSSELYPPESKPIKRAMKQAMKALGAILDQTGRLTLTYAEGALIANGEPLDLSEHGVLETSFVDRLKGAGLRAVSLTRDVTVGELRSLLLTMGTVVPGPLAPDFWRRMSRKESFRSVEVRQIRYTRIDPSPGGARTSRGEDTLSPSEMAVIPDLLRDFMKTASDVRLYPLGSERVSESVGALLASLQPILNRRPSLSLARVENLVLVNGEPADVTQWQSVADGFTSFLDALGLLSITFLSSLSRDDLDAFFGQLRDREGRQTEPSFWEGFANETGLTGIVFNKEAYAPEMIQALLASALSGHATRPARPRDAVADAKGGADIEAWDLDDGEIDLDPIEIDTEWDGRSGLDLDADFEGEVDVDESVVRVCKELLLEGKHEEIRELVSRVFSEYESADVGHRRAMVQTCGRVFHQVALGQQHQLAELTLDTLTAAVGTESEPSVLAEATGLLYEMAAAAIRFSDYRLAARLYDVVETRRSDLKAQGEAQGSPYAALVNVELDDHTCQLLIDDFGSGRTDRQAQASLAVGHMGVTASDLLIDVIKQERDLRVRQLAAGLLSELGVGAAEQLKETLLTEVLLEHRYRTLEVVDLVTKDLRMELAFNLGDENPKIRRAAFQLFERLREDDFVSLMLPVARSDEAGVAKGAIRSLATVGTPSAVRAIIQLLQETDSPALAVACCQGLGSLKAEGGVEILGGILSRRTLTFFKFHWNEGVRVVAAVALRQIGTPPALAILEEHQGDASMRIREMANLR